MRTTSLFTLVAVLLGALGCVPVFGTSLWTDTSRSVISDRRAAAIGDIITILVEERTTTSLQADHKTEKSMGNTAGGSAGLLRFFPSLSASADRSTAGTGTSTQSAQFVDRFSGTVTAITPQGNLQIEANRRVQVNKDELTVTVTGMVRPDDIAADNTIMSTQVADMKLQWSGTGPIAEKQRPGLISRFLSFLW
jgi:flagellar L-ring protein FlgH